MVKFNIVIAFLSFLSGIAYIVVGVNGYGFSKIDFFWGGLQIFLALFVVLTGFSRINLCISNKLLASAHKYLAFAFYFFIFVISWIR